MATETEGNFLAVTPAGAFHAIASGGAQPARTLLLHLLARDSSLSDTEAGGLTADAGLLARLLDIGWLARRPLAESAPLSSLESLLPELLPSLSDQGRALLADHQGLQIGYGGFGETEAQELAALSADALALARRCQVLLPELASRLPAAWALVDAAGNSQLGVWPLFLPQRVFALVIQGRPLFTRAAFPTLVWTLVRRYGDTPDHDPGGITAA